MSGTTEFEGTGREGLFRTRLGRRCETTLSTKLVAGNEDDDTTVEDAKEFDGEGSLMTFNGAARLRLRLRVRGCDFDSMGDVCARDFASDSGCKEDAGDKRGSIFGSGSG